MASFLGPESPRPLSVISEGYQTRYKIPVYPDSDKYIFGEEYDNQLYYLIHKHLELGTTDRFCYVGHSKGSYAERIVDKFCLIEPTLSVNPGHYSYVETETEKMLPIRVAHTGAEEYFRELAKDKNPSKVKFDKVLLMDAIRYFENPAELYGNIMKCLTKNGRMMIIHRPANITTLPMFKDAKDRVHDNQTPFPEIINSLQMCKLDVQWDLESLPVIMSKRKWYSMMNEKYPSDMEILSSPEIIAGVRELSEGMMKYEGDKIEFDDKLLLISVVNTPLSNGYPRVQRYGQSAMGGMDLKNLKYSMAITSDMQPMVKHLKKKSKCVNKSPFC